MTREKTLTLQLPIVLDQDEGVKLWLVEAPNEALTADLARLGFMQAIYPDERLGEVEGINALAVAAKMEGNAVYRAQLISSARSRSRTIAGDLLNIVRGYEPGATSASLGSVVSRDERVVLFQGQWVVWAKVIVTLEL